MTGYRVEWEMNIDADSPRRAAERAFGHMQRPGTTATVFDVYEHDGDGDPVRVDLMEPAEWEPCSEGCPGVVVDAITNRVQRCDDCARFVDDDAAAAFLVELARQATPAAHEDPLVCPECGGTNVECLDWVDANTSEVIGSNEPDNDGTWCRDCEGHNGLTARSEFERRQGGAR